MSMYNHLRREEILLFDHDDEGVIEAEVFYRVYTVRYGDNYDGNMGIRQKEYEIDRINIIYADDHISAHEIVKDEFNKRIREGLLYV